MRINNFTRHTETPLKYYTTSLTISNQNTGNALVTGQVIHRSSQMIRRSPTGSEYTNIRNTTDILLSFLFIYGGHFEFRSLYRYQHCLRHSIPSFSPDNFLIILPDLYCKIFFYMSYRNDN